VPDKRVTELTSIDAVTGSDLVMVIDDPAGTPVNKKATVNQVLVNVAKTDVSNTFTGDQTVDGDLFVTGEVNPAVFARQIPKINALAGGSVGDPSGSRTLLSKSLVSGLSLRHDEALAEGRLSVGNYDTQIYQPLKVEVESFQVHTGVSPAARVEHLRVHPTGGVTVGAYHTVDPGVGVVGAASLDLREGMSPPNPALDTARLYALDVNGYTQVEMRDGNAKVVRFASDNIVIAKVSGVAVTRGQCLYFSGAAGANPLVGLARADVITTMPCAGLALDSGVVNDFIRVLVAGTLQLFDTSAFTEGARLYVSPTTAGSMTTTVPIAPAFAQRVGIVTRSHLTQGEVLVQPTSVDGPPRLHRATHEPGGSDALTALDAAILTTGTLLDARLSANVLKYAGGYPGGTANYLRADGTFATPPAGTGNVVGPGSATNNAVALFSGTTGKLLAAGADGTLGGSLSIGATPASQGSIRLDSAGTVFARNVANTNDIRLLRVAGDTVTLGAPLNALVIAGSSVAFPAVPVTGATSLALGTNTATVGALRLANTGSLQFRNAANTADVQGMVVGADNRVAIGLKTNPAETSIAGVGIQFDVDTPYSLSYAWNGAIKYTMNASGIFPQTSMLSLGSSTVRWYDVCADIVTLGSNASTSGGIRLPNATGIWARNQANTANVELLNLTNVNVVTVGGVAVSNLAKLDTANTFTANQTITGTLTATGLGTTPLNATSLTTGTVPNARVAVSAASKLLGRGASGAGAMEEITLGTGLTMSGTTLSAAGGGGANTAYTDVANVFTKAQTISPSIRLTSAAGAPTFTFREDAMGTDAKTWRVYGWQSELVFDTVNDAEDTIMNRPLVINRAGNMTLGGNLLKINAPSNAALGLYSTAAASGNRYSKWQANTDGSVNLYMLDDADTAVVSIPISCARNGRVTIGAQLYGGDVWYPGYYGGGVNTSYYISGHSTWGLYSNTSVKFAGGIYTDGLINVASTATIAGATAIAGKLDITGGSGTGYSTAPIEIRMASSPRIGFHWPGVIASQIGMDSSGMISVWNNPGTNYERFACLNIYTSSTSNSLGDLVVRGGTNLQGSITLPVSTWIYSSEGYQRLHFASSSITYVKGHGITFRNLSDTDIATLDIPGNFNCIGNMGCSTNTWRGNIHTSGGYMYPGDVATGGGVQTSWYISGHSSYGLHINTGLYTVGNLWTQHIYMRGDIHFYQLHTGATGQWAGGHDSGNYPGTAGNTAPNSGWVQGRHPNGTPIYWPFWY
jgi:hypothetical protein